MSESQLGRITRRQFLVGAGAAFAGTALACGREQQATPYVSTSVPASTLMPSSTPARPATPSIAPTVPPEGSADRVLLNGKVITVDAADTIAQAVAIKDGLIQAVGTSDKIKVLADAKTKVVDLKGKAVTPGLIDAHNHLQVVGLMGTYFTAFLPPEVKSIPDLQKKLSEVTAETPKGEWIKGYYLTVGADKIPKRQDLDAVSPAHPVWLMQQGGHYGVANSLALKMAGITVATSNPTGGIIERDARGELTGVFYNHRAMDLLRKSIPPWTLEMAQENVVTTQPLFAACGVTSFQDNNVRGTDVVGTYLEAGKQSKLALRGAVYYTLEWPQDLDRALKEIEHYKDPFMRFAGFKFLIDGQAPTAYCHQPHNGIQWNMPTWEPQSFKKAVRALHDTGLQICVHCAGDAAVDLTLDAYAEAMKANSRPDPRHRVEHAILTTPEATKRMKDLGVVVSTQPQFLRSGGDYWETIFGEQRTKRAIVTREWLNAGVPVALGSDAPTTPWHTPQATLAGAVSRLTVSGRVHEPDQRMTIQEALRAHTMGSAYAAHEEKIKGSLEIGKLADLAVWNEDPYTASVERLFKATIAMTIVGGRIVYQA